MLVTQQEQLRADVTALVDRLGPGRSSLVPILQEVKSRHHGIDSDAMQIVADLLDLLGGNAHVEAYAERLKRLGGLALHALIVAGQHG